MNANSKIYIKLIDNDFFFVCSFLFKVTRRLAKENKTVLLFQHKKASILLELMSPLVKYYKLSGKWCLYISIKFVCPSRAANVLGCGLV